MKLGLGLLIIAAAVYAILRRMDVRLVLLVAAMLLGAIGTSLVEVKDGLTSVVRVFLTTLSNEQFVVPICTAMGFAHVLRLTGCDQHLVHLLVRPLQRVRLFLIPGAVLVGFIVNIPVISQTSTAVAIGPVLVPLLLAARISPLTTGAALLLGASLGGELINPGAPNAEKVIVTNVIKPGAPGIIQANVTQAHAANEQILVPVVTLTIPGNPGPQDNFDPRDLNYSSLVPFFTIVQ